MVTRAPLNAILVRSPDDGLPSINDFLTCCISFIFSGSRLHREPLDLNALASAMDPANPSRPFLSVKKGFTRLILCLLVQKLFSLRGSQQIQDNVSFDSPSSFSFHWQGHLAFCCSWSHQTLTRSKARTCCCPFYRPSLTSSACQRPLLSRRIWKRYALRTYSFQPRGLKGSGRM